MNILTSFHQFPVFNYHLSVKEGLKVGEVVTRFTATDPDQGINGTFDIF